MREQKKKQKVSYTILEIATASDKETQQYYLGKKSFRTMQSSARKTMGIGVGCIVLAVAVMILFGYYMFAQVQKKDAEIANLTAQMQELASQKEEIQGNLDEKILEQQEKEAIDALQYIPDNYPVTGVSSVVESVETVSLDENNTVDRPIAVFTGSQGATVLAAGSGTVLSVEEDANYGFKLTIDHGNGYISLYYNGGSAKVSAGDVVTKGTVLFELGSYNLNVAFQIIENGTYVSPMSLVEIQG